MFTKFAKLEVLDVKSAPSRVRSASLSKFADFNEYRTDDGYVYVRVRAISSRVNKNHDGWPSAELQKAYRTFIGKPIFVDHHNSDPKKARGVIVDAALHVEDAKTSALDPYYASAPAEHLPPTWIELLLEVDAKRFPKLAKAVVNGEIDGVSMGCNVEMSKCSHCGNEARSPEQYCKHVAAKGAYFDYIDSTGAKTSKRSYEDCYDIGFFEISFVFDPADETALVSDIKTSKVAAIHAEADTRTSEYKYVKQRGDKWVITQKGTGKVLSEHDSEDEAKAAFRAMETHMHGGSTKTADQNPPPQAEMTTAPDKVDTLRQEQVCPICGSDMEDGVCEVCNYEEPPEGFDNPDLGKAKEVDEQVHQQDAEQAAQGLDEQTPNNVQPEPTPGAGAPTPGAGAPPVTSKTKWSAPVKVENQRIAATNGGRINTQERPILPVTRTLSDKPLATKTVTQATKVESNTKENINMTTQKIADGATPQGEGVQAEKRVDVEGVGAVSGDPLSGIEHENVEKNTGDFTAPHTDTWSGGEGDSLGQQEPVTSETGDFFTVSNDRTAADAEDNAGEDAGADGSAKEGGPTWDKSDAGFPDHQPSRVDLNAPLKEEVGEGTKTFGDDKMHVGDPVTSESANEIGGPIGTAIASAKALQLKSFRVVEAEIEAGLTPAESKWERIAELENASEETLDALEQTVARVKTAGLTKKASAPQQKTAGVGRMPSFSKAAGFDIEAHSVSELNTEDVIGW